MTTLLPSRFPSTRTLLLACALTIWSTGGALLSAQTSASKNSPESVTALLPDAPASFIPGSTTSGTTALAIDQMQAAPGAPSSPSSTGQAGKPETAPNLGDLGLTPNQVAADPDLQARMDRRTQLLKIHQRLGLLTLVPLAAACISSAAAPPDPRHGSNGNTVGRDIHAALGAASAGLYAATAYYAIRAPKVSNEHARGGIKIHKYLIYIHAPGMVLTPILGAMAFDQANNGQKVHGIASAHSAVAWTTVASYSAAIVAVSWPIHLKF